MRQLIHHYRQMLANGLLRARRSHDGGTPGRQIATQLSNLYDDVVTGVYEDAIASHAGHRRLSEITLLAHGGFGRCDVSPHSDVDLMLLATRRSDSLAAEIAGTLTRDLGDIGLDLGLSIRGSREACALAWNDSKVFTSLSEVRMLSGSYSRYLNFYDRFRLGSMRRRRRIIAGVIEQRQLERRKWGETAYMLRPNVKRSRGGLRDIQSIRWIGFARYGESDLARLVSLGLLPAEDFRLVQTAYDFFLSVRHDLHFREGKSVDVLDRHLQMDVAQSWGYIDKDGVLAVEQFMRDYFENARNVRYAAAYCVEESTHRRLFSDVSEKVQSMRMDDDIRMGPHRIWVASDRLPQFTESLPKIINLMALANQHDRRIEHHTWRSIRLALKRQLLIKGRLMPTLDDGSIEAFKTLLDRPARLASLLRRMHDLRVIDWLIPAFARIRGMLQFNAYHKYTVDIHSIRAVEAATSLAEQADTPEHLQGMRRRYLRITDKWLLHLTLLIHDIGKGFEEDHCIAGERIAGEVAQQLKLTPPQAELMMWLVRHHLVVNEYAFRHDLSDPQIVLEFAKEVGSIRRLEWLVVHTVADLMAVGPDVASDWKLGLIEDLYRRTRRYFDSQSLPGSPNDPEIDFQRSRLQQAILRMPKEVHAGSAGEVIDAIPLSLLSRHNVDVLAETIAASVRMSYDEHLWVQGRIDKTACGIHFTILRREDASAVGTFAHTAGALSALGLTIRRAQIERFGEFAWNDFWVADLSSPDDSVHPERIVELTSRVNRLLRRTDKPLPKPPRRWSVVPRNLETNVLPTKVTFDNETIDRYTILALFAYDSPNLLYRVADAIAKHNLVLQFAKIDTHLDQVADVFYITTIEGERLTDPNRQQAIRDTLFSVVEKLTDEQV